jgi:hypothetical protein
MGERIQIDEIEICRDCRIHGHGGIYSSSSYPIQSGDEMIEARSKTMKLIQSGVCGLVLLLVFVTASVAGDGQTIAGLEKQLSRMEKEMKEISIRLTALKLNTPPQEERTAANSQEPPSHLEVVKTYLEVLPDTQVRDTFFRTVYLIARVRVQNVGTDPARDVVVYAACPDCEKLGWKPTGNLAKLSGTVKYLAPSDKEEISLTIAQQTTGVAQSHDNLAFPTHVTVRVHEGGCKENVCPIEVLTNRTAVSVSPEGSSAASAAEPFFRTYR